MSSTTTKTTSGTTASRVAQTKPGIISGLILVAAASCFGLSSFWDPLHWINLQAADVVPGDGVMVSIGIASVAAIGAGFAGVIVAYAISSERPAVIEFRNMVGPLLKANWLSVIGCAFSAAVLGVIGATLFATRAPSGAVWISIAALGLLLHSMARNMYLFSVLLQVIAIGDRREREVDQAVPVHQVITS